MKKWLLAAMFAVALAPVKGYSQGCSICTKTSAELGTKPATGLNKGIVYLAFLPLTILGSIGYAWYRHQKS